MTTSSNAAKAARVALRRGWPQRLIRFIQLMLVSHRYLESKAAGPQKRACHGRFAARRRACPSRCAVHTGSRIPQPLLGALLVLCVAGIVAAPLSAQAPAENAQPTGSSEAAGQRAAETGPPATDTVWYAPPQESTHPDPWYAAPLSSLRGRVIEYDAEELRLEMPDGSQRRVPAERVVRLEAELPEPAGAALRGYRDGKPARESIPELFTAIQVPPPVWVQRLLTASLAGAAFEANRFPAALELVAGLAAAGAPPPLIAELPIHWNLVPLPDTAASAALARLDDPEPLVRLVAASWLVATAQRSRAIAVLEALAADPAAPQIAKLADALLWSTFPPGDQRLVRSWYEPRLERLPIALQAGPLSILAAKFSAARRDEETLELLLRIALHYDSPRWIVAQARRDSVDLLQSLGRAEESERLEKLFGR